MFLCYTPLFILASVSISVNHFSIEKVDFSTNGSIYELVNQSIFVLQ